MFTLNCNGRSLVVDKPLVMGIINITPDSFYQGSRSLESNSILEKAEQMLKDGADILDVGGQSTRPGSEKISAEEELTRIIKPIEAISRKFPDAYISVDTFYSKVAIEATQAGACIVNDISGGQIDEKMFETIASLNVPYVLMHMKGTPQNMQNTPHYDDIIEELKQYFTEKLNHLQKIGVKDVIIDPGFGFGKTIAHNFELLRHLSIFTNFNCPLLIGVSRKSSIYKTLHISENDALNGTTVLNTIALLNGANILRVHDVKEAKEVVNLFQAYSKK